MSGVFSKSFKVTFPNHSCRDIVHPQSSCAKWLMQILLFHAPIGALKFYFLVCLSSLLFRIREWNKLKTWKDFMKLLSQSLLFGYGFISTFFAVLCLEYRICGRYFLPSIIVLPAFVGILFSYFLPKPILKAEALGLFNIYVEFLLRSSRSKTIEYLRESRVAGSIVFSILNTLIMCGMLKANCPNFWFSKFNLKTNINNESTQDICKRIHSNFTCHNYFLKEMKETLKFSLGLCAIKAILPCIGKVVKNPLTIFSLLFKNFDKNLFALVMGIDGIFKYLFCHLNRKKQFMPVINCAIASFLAGLSYAFFPRYEVFTLAITNAATMIYKMYESSYNESEKDIPMIMKFINKLPIYHIMFILPTSMLIQLRIIYPYFVNRSVNNFLAIGTNGISNEIIYRAVSLFMGYSIK